MNKRTYFFIFLLFLLVVILGVNYFTTPFLERYEQQTDEKTDPAAQQVEGEDQVVQGVTEYDRLLVNMTPEEKIAQLISYPVLLEVGDDPTETGLSDQVIEAVSRFKPGMVVLFGSNLSLEQTSQAIAQLRQLYQGQELNLMVGVDHEGGQVQRLSGAGFTRLPAMRTACYEEVSVLTNLYQQSAQELSQAGIDVVFAPVVDVARDGSFLGSRACQDPTQIKRTAQVFIEAFGYEKILPVIKHFPGIGLASADLHEAQAQVALEPVDTKVFSDLLDVYPNIGVMVSHLRLEDRLDNMPCSLSRDCLTTFHQKLQEVILFTDALDMASAEVEPPSADLAAEETASEAADLGEDLEADQLSYRSEQALLAGENFLVFGKGVDEEDIARVVEYLAQRYQESDQLRVAVNQVLLEVLPLKLAKGES